MYEIEVIDVWKRFKWLEDRPQHLKESILSLWHRRTSGQEFWALRGVNFSVKQGETFALVGNNGAGKSTMLRLIGGLMTPTKGRVVRSVRVSTMIELGLGFHLDFTGRENVYTGGIISGLTKREIQEAFPKIVEFAELEQYIDRPVRTYSTGMYMRLAFSLAIHVDSQILLLDEVLAVGDQNFQRKCIDRLYRLKDEGKTIVLVSHDLNMVKSLCDRACWLENGRVRQEGQADEVVSAYAASTQGEKKTLAAPQQNRASGSESTALTLGVNRWGSLDVEIEGVTLSGENGSKRTVFETGQKMEIGIRYACRSAVREAIFQIAFSREDGVKCFDVNTWDDGVPMPELEDSGVITLSIGRIDLGPGSYTIDVGTFSLDWAQIYDYHSRAYSFDVFSQTRHEWGTHNGERESATTIA